MAIMTNAEAFEYDFGIYATELWSMTEEQFLTWLNSECDRERPRDMIVRCKDCKHRPERVEESDEYDMDTDLEFPDEVCPCQCDDCYYSWMPKDDWFCASGERKEE